MKKDLKPKDAAKAILGGALALAGVFDVLEALEDGSELAPAVKGAIKSTKKRKKALKKTLSGDLEDVLATEPSVCCEGAKRLEGKPGDPSTLIGWGCSVHGFTSAVSAVSS